MHIAKQGDADDEIVEFSSDEGSPRQQVPCYGENGCSEFAEMETGDKPIAEPGLDLGTPTHGNENQARDSCQAESDKGNQQQGQDDEFRRTAELHYRVFAYAMGPAGYQAGSRQHGSPSRSYEFVAVSPDVDRS